MLVRELMSSVVYSCRPQDSLDEAANLLWEHDCGALPVLDAEGHPGGMLTDRDICMCAYTTGKPLSRLRVADAMSRRIVVCRDEENLVAAARTMADNAVRRLPVVDANGVICGLLSLNDLSLAAEEDPAIGREALRVLMAVCRHRAAVPTAAAARTAPEVPVDAAPKTVVPPAAPKPRAKLARGAEAT